MLGTRVEHPSCASSPLGKKKTRTAMCNGKIRYIVHADGALEGGKLSSRIFLGLFMQFGIFSGGGRLREVNH